MNKKDQILMEGKKRGLSIKEIHKLREEVVEQEHELTLKIYDFFKENLKDDQGLKDFARKHYDSFLANDSEWSSFEDWYEESVYNMDSACVEGVEEWLGQLSHDGKIEEFLEGIKFKEFIDSLDGHFNVELRYTEGVYIDIYPIVHVHVEIL